MQLNSNGSLFLSGLFWGLSALARPATLLVPAILAVWLGFRKRHAALIVLLAGTAAVIAPITVRNAIIGGEFALTTVSGGMNFYVGNNPEAIGLYVEPEFLPSSDPRMEFEAYIEEAERRSWEELSPAEASRFWFSEGALFLLKHPLQWAKLWGQKFFYFWNALEAPNNISYYLAREYSPLLRALPLNFALLAALGLPGLLLMRKGWLKDLLWLYLAVIVAVNVIFFTSSEYRFPALLALLPGAGVALERA